MIDLKQLRIGNIINIDLPNNPTFQKHFITIGDFYDISCGRISNSICQYVHITNKLLKNLGFKKFPKTNEVGLDVGMTKFVLLNNTNCWTTFITQNDEVEKIKDNIILQNDIKYLHQLQNLIYAISEIELMDIVAYNYFLEITKNKEIRNNFFKALTFKIENLEQFLEAKLKYSNFIAEINIKYQNIFDYKIGDLPQNLFDV